MPLAVLIAAVSKITLRGEYSTALVLVRSYSGLNYLEYFLLEFRASLNMLSYMMVIHIESLHAIIKEV